MKKNTMMWVGGAALAAVVVGGIAYAAQQKTVAPAAVPHGVPVTTLTPGQQYAFAAQLPPGITDTAQLTNALVAAGWTNVNVFSFMGTNATPPPAGLPAITVGGYGATAIWGGKAGPVQPGVIAVAV